VVNFNEHVSFGLPANTPFTDKTAQLEFALSKYSQPVHRHLCAQGYKVRREISGHTCEGQGAGAWTPDGTRPRRLLRPLEALTAAGSRSNLSWIPELNGGYFCRREPIRFSVGAETSF
jgi:hypothetical protein